MRMCVYVHAEMCAFVRVCEFIHMYAFFSSSSYETHNSAEK